MANKDQRKGNRETRKPKQAKSPKQGPAVSPFAATPARPFGSAGGKKK